jgi:hypothetical protein
MWRPHRSQIDWLDRRTGPFEPDHSLLKNQRGLRSATGPGDHVAEQPPHGSVEIAEYVAKGTQRRLDRVALNFRC